MKMEDEALDLTGEYTGVADAGSEDDLLANADRLATDDKPVEAHGETARKRPVLGGNDGETGAADGAGGGGSTLFERMANLSRGSGSDEEDDDDDDDEDGDGDAPALSIPRFLGRQNNQ